MTGPRALPPLLLGLALLGAAGAVPSGQRATAAPGTAALALNEPLAAALEPLGPLRPLISSALWVQLLRSRLEGDDEQVLLFSEGLIALHPELERVREHLASQLIVTEAPRAANAERHRALVQRGLCLLEDGQLLSESPRLHGALGRLLTLQVRVDARFAAAARQYFGSDPVTVAIDELREAGTHAGSDVFLADLLVERGLVAWTRDADVRGADRDLAEAEALTSALPGEEAQELTARIAEIRREMASLLLPANPDGVDP